MQFTTAIISAITMAVASASVIGTQRYVTFKVSDFSAGCVAHSSQCLYSFTVIQPGTMETTGVKCTALVGSIDGTLPNIAQWQGSCGDESSRTFWITREDAGLEFYVSQPVSPASNTTASYLIPNSELVLTPNTIGTTQSYTGPSDLDLYQY
ncbi:hypothetical protein SBOR_7277 [Sclerotinia borealis F-4128]|uniref:Hypersensitive response-inducing protein n=1 Tax=Sclerotinia borealis (strain F-4128) TaxID=1432307 RepID=W9C969_SCLBF|nr:hypothetical protein SBOR_7277 [Sclerotinia borealis F-4128]